MKWFSAIFLILTSFTTLEATPSTVFWTVCTTDVYATGTCHIDEDNYFTVFNQRGYNSFFPSDTGLELGIFSWNDWSAEAGVDYLGGTNNPFYFNAGIAIAEEKLFALAPALKIGIFNVGTSTERTNRTDYNIVNVIAGKSLPKWLGGRVCVGGFSGSRGLGKNRQGFMASYQRPFCSAKYCDDREYFKWVFCADYASGKNAIGGGGFGIYYYFTPDISILTGPVWFNSRKILGDWKWSVQIDISFSIF